MTEEWISFLSDHLKAKGTPLNKFGIDATAWPISCGEGIISSLQQHGWTILGGDLYKVHAGALRLTYDSWSCNVRKTESWSLYQLRSCDAARQFISGWLQSDRWVSVVAVSKPNAQQLASIHAR